MPESVAISWGEIRLIWQVRCLFPAMSFKDVPSCLGSGRTCVVRMDQQFSICSTLLSQATVRKRNSSSAIHPGCLSAEDHGSMPVEEQFAARSGIGPGKARAPMPAEREGPFAEPKPIARRFRPRHAVDCPCLVCQDAQRAKSSRGSRLTWL
jgi:hypothetical protein